jgi:uncharacterized membrane protein HdeD (DUF308 family)
MTSSTPGAEPGNEERPSGPLLSEQMSALLARNWWAVLLRGLIAVALGILTFWMPVVSLASLVLMFAAYMLADGVLGIIAAVRAARRHERWGWLVLEGLLDIGTGVVALAWPGLTIIVFVALVAAWAIVSGGTMVLAALRFNKRDGRWLMGLAGVLSIAWGVLLAFAPISGALVLTLWLGAYALVFGITLIIFSLRLRRQRPA